MAKVRVYELARELSMESKDLVDKLIAAGANVKNYMSTLDDDEVAKAREIVSGVVSEVIEEKRIKPTVIRRRKKIVVEPEAVPDERAEEALLEPAEPALPPEEIPPGEEIAPSPAHPEAAETSLAEEAPLMEEVPEMTPAAEARGAGEGGLAAEEVEEEAEAGLPEEREAAEPVKRAGVKPKKTKKKRIDQPARIISRPEEGPLKDVLAKPAQEEAETPVVPVSERAAPSKPAEIAREVTEKEKKAKPAKRKKDRKKTETVEEAPRSQARFRKKEVFERADLYEGRGPKRRDRKGGKKEVARRQRQPEITVPKAIKRRIRVEEVVPVAELAKAMGVKAVEVIRKLLSLGVTANINYPLDFDTAVLVAEDFGYEVELGGFEEKTFIAETEDKPEDLIPRPPVVTIMGHVDHGKTSLLDYIRKSKITEGESGGITQHIGAYYVQGEAGDIVFLDTPGHEAFTAMRARGAKVTDLIVLVVAADDGVMPQTKEAVNHARAANIPIVVAINKIDKADANPDKVKRELAELGLSPEEWGGETIFGQISAKTGEGVDELLGLILLQAEMLELHGNPNKPARGTVVEAKLDKTKGPVATVLIKNGTLNPGDYFICGQHFGRVRAMLNHRGKKMKSATPSVPVEIYGISGVPMAGDEFIVVQDEKTAKQVIDHRKAASRKHDVTRRGIVSLDDLFGKIKEGEVKEFNIVLKADVQGSLEALSDSLEKLSTDEVKLKIIHSAAGAITESDVMLASASNAVIIGFNVRANPRGAEVAEKEGVDIRYYDVIYNVIKDIRLAMAGLLEPVFKENVIGHAEIKEVFRIPKVGSVAGCYVTDGHIVRNANVRLLRDGVVVVDGKIASLRRFKEDVKEVQSGYECGIGLENYQDMKPADVFEAYELEKVEAEL
jgi:translation initiation factor IF-2